MARWNPCNRIPVICYDQIGNGASTHLPNAPKEFWTPDLFMDELENLLKHLEISDNFDLVGQSWGGMYTCEGSSLKPLNHFKLRNAWRSVCCRTPAERPETIDCGQFACLHAVICKGYQWAPRQGVSSRIRCDASQTRRRRNNNIEGIRRRHDDIFEEVPLHIRPVA